MKFPEVLYTLSYGVFWLYRAIWALLTLASFWIRNLASKNFQCVICHQSSIQNVWIYSKKKNNYLFYAIQWSGSSLVLGKLNRFSGTFLLNRISYFEMNIWHGKQETTCQMDGYIQCSMFIEWDLFCVCLWWEMQTKITREMDICKYMISNISIKNFVFSQNSASVNYRKNNFHYYLIDSIEICILYMKFQDCQFTVWKLDIRTSSLILLSNCFINTVSNSEEWNGHSISWNWWIDRIEFHHWRHHWGNSFYAMQSVLRIYSIRKLRSIFNATTDNIYVFDAMLSR